MAKKRGSVQKKDLELLISKIKEMGLFQALVEWSDWDDFDGADLGDSIYSLKIAVSDVKEKIEDACIEKGIEFSFIQPEQANG